MTLFTCSRAGLAYALAGADGSCGADEAAEVATYAFGSYEVGLARVGIEADGLMTTVHAGHIATPAPHALLAVYLREDDGLAVEVGGGDEIRQLLAHDV